MIVFVNGERREVEPGATVSTVVALLANGERRDRGVAVAVDGEVVPRGGWSGAVLAEGTRVEVVAPIQGG
jgi:sulfur carrier protein